MLIMCNLNRTSNSASIGNDGKDFSNIGDGLVSFSFAFFALFILSLWQDIQYIPYIFFSIIKYVKFETISLYKI